MDLQSIIENYGYAAILIGTFLEGETILVLAGLAAHQGCLVLTWVILAAFMGSLCGDQLFFYLGRKHSLEGESGKSPQADEPISNTDDPILSVSLRAAHGCPLCHWNEPRIPQKVHCAQCSWSVGLGGSLRNRRLYFRSCPGDIYRKDQAL